MHAQQRTPILPAAATPMNRARSASTSAVIPAAVVGVVPRRAVPNAPPWTGARVGASIGAPVVGSATGLVVGLFVLDAVGKIAFVDTFVSERVLTVGAPE
jgi:hypothetical protein